MSNNICLFQFGDGKMVKNLFSMIKDVIDDIMIIVTKNEIKIINMNKEEDILVDITLEVVNLEEFNVEKDKIMFCVDSHVLYKVLNFCENKKPVLFYIKENDFENGMVKFLHVKIDENLSCIKTIENEVEIHCEKLDYDVECKVETKVFLKKLRNVLLNADTLNLCYRNSLLTMINDNEFVKINNKIENDVILCKNNDNYEEKFLSKNIKTLLKVVSFSESLVLCLLEKSPLLVEIDLFDIGSLCLYFKTIMQSE